MGKPGLTQDRWVSCWHFIKLIIFKYLLCIYLVGVGETVYLQRLLMKNTYLSLNVENKGFITCDVLNQVSEKLGDNDSLPCTAQTQVCRGLPARQHGVGVGPAFLHLALRGEYSQQRQACAAEECLFPLRGTVSSSENRSGCHFAHYVRSRVYPQLKWPRVSEVLQ